MPGIQTTLVIDASPDAIWSVLSDWPAYGEWCALIPVIRGEARLAGDVDIRLRLGALAAPIDATITRFEPNRALEWTGPRSRALGLFASGRHSFEIVDFGDGRSRLVHGETFTGPGFRLPWRLLKPRLERAYADFNRALAERVEAQAKA